MKHVRIVDRSSGEIIEQRLEQPHASIAVSRASTIQIAMSIDEIVAWEREGGDLVVRFVDGTSLRIEGYFDCVAPMPNELIFAEPDGDLWRAMIETQACAGSDVVGTDTVSASFEPVVEEGGRSGWLWPVYALAGAGAIGGIVLSGSGGGRSRGDTTAPAAPTVKPANGTLFTGTAEPGSTVELDLDGDGVADLTTTADGNGNWSVAPAAPVADGTVVRVTAVDAAGNVSAPTEVMVDAIPPAPPVIHPSDGTSLTGTAEPDSSVTIDLDGDGQPDMTVTVDSNGNWSVPLDAPLPGNVVVTAIATDAAGNQSAPAVMDAVAPLISIDTPLAGDGVINAADAASNVQITGQSEVEDGQVVTVTLTHSSAPGSSISLMTSVVGGQWSIDLTPQQLAEFADGPITVTASVADKVGNTSSTSTSFELDVTAPTTAPTLGGVLDDVGTVTGPINAGDVTDDARPTFTGSDAESGSTVNVYDNGVLIGTAPVNEDGTWSFTPDADLGDGAHSITFSNVDAAGNEGPQSPPFTVTVDTEAPTSAPTLGGVLDDVGTVTGAINAGDVTDDTRPTFTGSDAEPGSTVNVYDNGVLIGTAPVNEDGTWSFTPDADLGDGAHSITFSNVDVAGNEGPQSPPFTVTVDTEAPMSAPTLGGVLDDVGAVTGPINAGDVTDDPRPTFTGSDAEPGSTVNVYDNGVLIGTVPVNADGTWSFTPDADLGDGPHSITFSNVDEAGNEGPQSPPFTVTVDTEAPTSAPTLGGVHDDVAPVTGPVADGGATNDPRPTFAGSDAEPGSTVNVYDDGVLIGTVPVNEDGTWSFTPDADLGDGAHSITFSNVDAVGNEGPQSPPFTVTVDTDVPTSAPTLGGVLDDVGTVTGPINAGDVTDDPRPTFTGSDAEPGSTVNVYDNGVLIGTAPVNEDGTWSFTPDADLGDGAHSITFSNVDAAGNEGPQSLPFTVTVDTEAPTAAPSLQNAEDDVGSITGPIDPGAVTDDARPAFTGSGAEPGSTIRVYDNGTLIGTASADAVGDWSFTPDADLNDGVHSLTFSSVDTAGNEGPQSDPFTFTVDTEAPTSAPTLGGVHDDVGPITGALNDGDVTDDARPTFTGSGAEPNSTINVYDNGTLIGTTTADDAGNWSFTPSSDLADGAHSLTFSNEDAAGNEGPLSGTPFTFTVDATAPSSAPTLGGVHDDVAPVTGPVTNGGATNDPRPTFTGSGAEPNSTINVYDNGVLIDTVPVDAAGNWSFTPSVDLGDGAHSVTFSNVDEAGNEGPKSTPFTFIVDTAAPTSAPSLGGVHDDVGEITGPINAGDVTDDARPTFTGSGAEPGSTIHVYDDGVLIGTVPVNADGTWSFTPSADLGEGPHLLTFSNVDAAGNEGPESAPITFTVDTVAPASAPTLDDVHDDVGPGIGPVVNGGATNDPRPTFTGSGAEPNSTIRVYDHGTLIGTATTDGAGNWSFTPSSDLADGTYSFTFSNVDAAGNEGPQSATPFDFTVDTRVPTSVAIIDSISPDTGDSNADFVTSATSLTVHGHLDAPLASGERLQISIDNGASWIDVVPTGTSWSYVDTRVLTDGVHTYQSRILGVSGLEGTVLSQAVTIDTTAPAAISITHIDPDTAAADFITSATSLTVHGTLAAELAAGERAQISIDGGVSWTDLTVAGTSWSHTDTRTLSDGQYVYQVRTIDAAGNINAGAAQTVTVDTTAPSGIAIDAIEDDTGLSATDLITSDTSITLSGHLDAELELGEGAQISIDGGATWTDITAVAGTAWTYTDTRSLTDGNYEYQVRVVDAAGNASAVTSRTVTVDTTMPDVLPAPTIDDSVDPVRGNITDGMTTNDSSPVMSGSGAEPNSIVRIYEGAPGSEALIGEVLADAAGNWTFTLSAPLADGTYAWSVSNVDIAGNEGSRTVPITFTVDTQLPADSQIDALQNDTGASATDFITNDPNLALTGTFSQPLAAGEVAYISVNGAAPVALAAGEGATMWAHTAGGMADGVYYFEVYVTDGAGNVGASDTRKVVVDTTAPGAITIDSIAVDSGESSSDFVTSATSITVSGTLAAPLAVGDLAETAQISLDGGASWIDLTVNGTSWTYVDTRTHADGPVDYQVRIIDLAGNEGPVATQMVTIDTTPPPVASIDAIAPDTGAAGDFTTSATSITVQGSVAAPLDFGERVQVSTDGGASWSDAIVTGTTWSFTDPRTLNEGSHVYQVRTIDLAGNVTAGAGQTVVVDTTAPSQAVFIDSIDQDTGTSASDFLTSDSTPTIHGHLDTALVAGESVEVSFDGGATWNVATVSGTNWSYAVTSALAEGLHDLMARVVDAAGNSSPVASRTLTIDLTPPPEAIVQHYVDAVGESTGNFGSGTTTDDMSPLLVGTLSAPAEDGWQLHVYRDATLIGSVNLTAGQTDWTYQLSDLPDGAHNLAVVVVDEAGLQSAPAPFVINVDTTPPVVTTLSIDDIDTDTYLNNAVSKDEDNDFVTRATTITVRGAADFEVGGILQISSDGGATWSTLTVTGGVWEYVDPTPRASDVTYQVRVVDALGQVSPVTASRTVTVDLVAPAASTLAPVLAPADDTGVLGDNVTTRQNITFSSDDSGQKDSSATILLVHDVNRNGIFDVGIDTILAQDSTPGGAWAISATLPYGEYSLGFVQVDHAGNLSRMSPTTDISIHVSDDHEAGDFTGSSPLASNTLYAGMGSGISAHGELQLTVRRVVITQTSLTDGVNSVPDNPAPASSTVTNNTFLDFNRDGLIDYATSDNVWVDNRQTIYVGQADGTYQGYRQAVGTNAALGGVVAFDKEGDGYLEIIWGDWGNDSPLGLAINEAGTLQTGDILAAGTTLISDREMSGVDIDNDGDIDLAVHSYRVNGTLSAYAFTLLSNDGSGVYSVAQTLPNIFHNTDDVAGTAVSMTWADFDGDGDLDLYLNRTRGSDVSGIFLNEGGQISPVKIAIGDASGSALGGAISVAVDWNHDGRMDVVEFARPNTTGPIQLYLNTTDPGGALSFASSPLQLATGLQNIGGGAAVDYDWDGDVDVVYQLSSTGQVRTIENLNQVEDGTSLHLRIVDHEGFNVFYGNTVQLFDSAGNLVATQILNPQSGVGTNDSTGIVHFYGLSHHETYTVALVRTVNGVSQDVSGVASLTGGAANLSTVEVVNRTWTGLRPGAANSAYVLSAESDAAVNHGSYAGTGYNDTFFHSAGNDTFEGGGGWSIGISGAPAWSATGGMDIVDYGAAAGPLTVDLSAGAAAVDGDIDTLINIEGIRGTAADDVLVDSAESNLFEGRGGNDTIDLANGGQDIVLYQLLDADDPTGGNGQDQVHSFTVGSVQSDANADVLDLRDLLRSYQGTANVYWDVTEASYVLDYASRGLLDYLNVTVSGGDTLIQVDLAGTGNFTTLATLVGVQTSLAELLGNQQLWIASSHTTPRVIVNALTTADDTPIITGALPFALGAGQQLRVQVDGVTYSSANLNEVVVDPLNDTWYVQVTAPLAAGTYSVTAAVWNGDGSLAMQDRTSGELIVSSAPDVTFGGAGGASNKATALTLGESGVWRIFSNDTVYDSKGVGSGSLGSYSANSITVSGQNTQSATFMDFNRDGYMDIFGIDQAYADGQQSWSYDGSFYTPFQVGGSGNTSAEVYSWYGGIMAYDKVGDGYADLVYGDETPNDASAGGGYDSQFVLNNGGVFIKDGAYVHGAMGSPAPTNTGNATPDKEVSGVDINNDGTVDIVYHGTTGSNYRDASKTTTSTNDYRLVVVTNVGDGALYSSQVVDNVFYHYTGTTSYAPSMTWADFNGDGYMDLFLGRGRMTSTGAVNTNSTESRILYNDHGTLVQSVTGDYATTFLGDSVAGGASLALDWDRDGRMDVIELPEYASGASTVNLYINNGDGTFSTTQLINIPSSENITGAVAFDLDWDGDKDLVFFRSNGVTTYISNDSAPAAGESLHLRIVDAEGINAFFGNTVQLYDSAGNWVASQIINPQSGMQTNDSTAIVDFHGLDPNETYTAVLLTHVNGASSDVGGVAVAGGNTIEQVNATWTGLRTGAAHDAYVLTAEADTNSADTVGPGIVGTGYNDRLFATLGNDVYNGGGGWHHGEWSNTGGEDIIDFVLAGSTGVTVDLRLTTAQNTGFNTVTLINIEGVAGGAGDDVFTGNAADNIFEGRGGNDTILLGDGGQDTILYRLLEAADATGGNGADTITGFKVGVYEATPGADRIDLRELLIGYTGDADGAAHYVNGVATLDPGETISQYLQVTNVGGDSIISIDRDGAGGVYDFTVIATLEGVTTDLETLLANHQLVVA